MPCIFYINTLKRYTQKHQKYIKYSIFHDFIEIYSFVTNNFLFIMLEKCFSIAPTSLPKYRRGSRAAATSKMERFVLALREKCPNTEFLLVHIFPHSDWIREIFRKFSPDAGKYGPEKLRIWIHFIQFRRCPPRSSSSIRVFCDKCLSQIWLLSPRFLKFPIKRKF